jgi:hypothetical protein
MTALWRPGADTIARGALAKHDTDCLRLGDPMCCDVDEHLRAVLRQVDELRARLARCEEALRPLADRSIFLDDRRRARAYFAEKDRR